MIPALIGGAALKWLLVGGAVVAGGALLASSDDKPKKNSGDIVKSERREIPESEVPADILAKVKKIRSDSHGSVADSRRIACRRTYPRELG